MMYCMCDRCVCAMCMTFVCDVVRMCTRDHTERIKCRLLQPSGNKKRETEYAKAPEESREQCHALANVHMAQCPTQVAPSQEPVTTPLAKIKGG